MGSELVTMCSDFDGQLARHSRHRRAAIENHGLAVFNQARGEPRDAALLVAQAHALCRVVEGATRRRLHGDRAAVDALQQRLPASRMSRSRRTLDSEASRSRQRVSESTKSRVSNIWRILSCRSAAFIVWSALRPVRLSSLHRPLLAPLLLRCLPYFPIASITASVTDFTSDSRSAPRRRALPSARCVHHRTASAPSRSSPELQDRTAGTPSCAKCRSEYRAGRASS